MLANLNTDKETVNDLTILTLEGNVKTGIFNQMNQTTMTSSILIPNKWWTPLDCVMRTEWSRALMRTLSMNLQLGNQNHTILYDYRAAG